MTWLGPKDVLELAHKAGWSGDGAKFAAAVALVASNGADHYEWDDGCLNGAHDVGLWALSCPIPDDGMARALLDPNTNAAVARMRWVDYGRGWDWHPVYAKDGGREVRKLLANLNASVGWQVEAKHLHRPIPPEAIPDSPPSMGDIIAGAPGI